jgi:hypothetical protein
MSKPRFIRSSQEDFTPQNNPYGLDSFCQNVLINLTNVSSIFIGTRTHQFSKKSPNGGANTKINGYVICFSFVNDNSENTITWVYISEIMRDSDYGRILELFEVKL